MIQTDTLFPFPPSMSGSVPLRARPETYTADAPAAPQQHSSATSQGATLFVDRSARIQGISQAAAELLHLDEDYPSGQSLNAFAGGLLSVLTLHYDRPAPATLLTLDDGRTLLVTTRCVRGRNEQLRGWMLTLQDISTAMQQVGAQPAAEAQASTPPADSTCDELQQKVQSMRELVALLPNFSQRQDWRELLIDHMQQLLEEMSSTLRQHA
jgi:transcriptional regulator with PAS, ATPase and Fis domain